jgi:hypothetical protein
MRRFTLGDGTMTRPILLLASLSLLLVSVATAQAPAVDTETCDIDSVAGMVWRGRVDRMPLSQLAAYLAPVFWFSPD